MHLTMRFLLLRPSCDVIYLFKMIQGNLLKLRKWILVET